MFNIYIHIYIHVNIRTYVFIDICIYTCVNVYEKKTDTKCTKSSRSASRCQRARSERKNGKLTTYKISPLSKFSLSSLCVVGNKKMQTSTSSTIQMFLSFGITTFFQDYREFHSFLNLL